MLERLPMRTMCTEQWRHVTDSNEPSYDINTVLAKVSTSKFPPFIKVQLYMTFRLVVHNIYDKHERRVVRNANI